MRKRCSACLGSQAIGSEAEIVYRRFAGIAFHWSGDDMSRQREMLTGKIYSPLLGIGLAFQSFPSSGSGSSLHVTTSGNHGHVLPLEEREEPWVSQLPASEGNSQGGMQLWANSWYSQPFGVSVPALKMRSQWGTTISTKMPIRKNEKKKKTQVSDWK